MCDKHFEGMNPNMKIEQTTTSDKVSAVASNDVLGVKLTAEVILSVKQIVELAEFAGVYIDRYKLSKDEMETPIAIMKCPEGMKWEDEPNAVYEYAAYYDEYPQEGIVPLGDRTNA